MSLHELDQNNTGAPPLQFPIDIYGLWGDSSTGSGVVGTSDAVAGTVGHSNGNVGVAGSSETSVGVKGDSLGGYSFGVWGTGYNAGIIAQNRGNDNAAYLASNCCAAWFTGPVYVSGPLTKAGGGFRIDHPLDPAGKQLCHSFVESSEMKNIYDGVVALDSRGEATVELPQWLDALNTDFRYQLTCVGGYAPVYVAQEIEGNQFRIAGGNPGLKVSWQVTGIRHDAWANAHRIQVEEDKVGEERGRYLHPELHAASKQQSIERMRHPLPEQAP